MLCCWRNNAPVFTISNGDTHVLQGTFMSEFNGLGSPPDGLNRTRGLPDDCKESLLAVIEQQIIPRLLNVQQFFTSPSVPVDAPDAALPDHEPFTQHCLHGDALQANGIVDALIHRGLSQERIFLELITPAARQLGVLWEQDLCDFTQVTCGLAIMHQTIYRLGYESPVAPHDAAVRQRVMLACAPGSQHFLGLTIVADFFRKSGAEVVLEISSSESELLRAVGSEWFDVIGISVAIEAQLPSLPGLIAHLRESSGNAKVIVMLGGPVFLLRELSPQDLGADGIFTDAREAVAAVQGLMPLR
jgi:methanogenic corrinoid protein MtbC1